MSNYVLRDARPEDSRFIVSSWLRSWKVSPYAGCIPNHLYRELTRQAYEGLVIRGAKLRVAESPNENGRPRLLAWLCSEVTREGDAVVHAGYCKDAYLPLHPLEALVDEVQGKRPIRYTHRTVQLVRALPPGSLHCPEIARRKN